MANEVSRVIPVAKRITEFKTEDMKKPVSMVDGWGIVRYAEEFPIVHYTCDELECVYLEGGFRLNSFIESITVSAVRIGKKAYLRSCELVSEDDVVVESERTDYDVVVYYTDHVGINHEIIQHDLHWFLLQKPNLVVSPEGVLIFFTDKQIIATVGCNNSYHWIDGHVIDVEGKTIKNIEVCDDYCKVILLDDKKVEQCFSLKFDFDVTSYQILVPKASEL